MGKVTKHAYANQDEWLELRTSLSDRLGGSEVGIAAGHSPYCSAYTLFCQKVGLQEEPDISDKEAVIQGHDLEEYVAERFTRATGKGVHSENFILTNSDAPHLKASPDRLLDDGESGLECKTVKDMVMRKFKRGDFPQGYYDQCATYIKVSGRKRWYLAMLVFGTAFKIFLMTTVKEEADRFAELKQKVEDKIPLTEEEQKQWDTEYSYLEACYFIDQAELDGCEEVAASFIGRCQAFMAGDGAAWPLDEIDASESTYETLQAMNGDKQTPTTVTFDESHENGVTDSGEVYTDYSRNDVEIICNRRGEIKELIGQLEEELAGLDNKVLLMMNGREKFVLPEWTVTNKMGTARKYAKASAVEEYFKERGIPIPDGMVTESEPKMSLSFRRRKKK